MSITNFASLRIASQPCPSHHHCPAPRVVPRNLADTSLAQLRPTTTAAVFCRLLSRDSHTCFEFAFFFAPLLFQNAPSRSRVQSSQLTIS